ncbi:MAG: CCA tRNA nucleotidyltransferase [Candidatus Doudnabacteria bacterium]|nr:CCA tRNA nucleotidyltransferase [Candidatus Doudnabacteria bacterium]
MSLTKLKSAWPEKSRLSQGAFGIVRILRKAGFEAFIAGGAVRDAVLTRPIKEIDIATAATPDIVKKLFRKTIPTGEKHGTVTVYPHFISPYFRKRKQGEKERGSGYEVTTFRKEGPYRKHRWPTRVKFLKSAEEDAKRRDFTVNALFYDPETREVLDYINGIADISHRRIRFIGNPEDRIREDALRLLRAVRFATILQFDLARETQKAIKKNARLIAKISAERVKQELDKILISPRASVGFGLLDIVGLLALVLPEIKNLQGVSQPKNQHSEGDVYTHSLLALEGLDEHYDLATRYAVLFHDIGKAKTREIRDGKITFYNHQNIGADMAGKICKRLRFSKADTEKIAWLVKNHMVPNDFAQMRLGTRRKWGLSPHFQDLLLLYKADAQASLPSSGKPDTNPVAYREGLKILKEIKEHPELKKPLISGNDVMKVLKIKEGPLVGKILRQVEEKKLAGKIKTKAQALDFLKNLR